jgi:AcrR family transcriptional regulator
VSIRLPKKTRKTKTTNRRDDILKAAARLFCHKGYEATTVRDLAEAVDIQSGSLFFHFETKEDILLAVLEAGLLRAASLLEGRLAAASTPREKLAAIFHGHLQATLGEERDAFTVVLREWRALSPRSRKKIVALRDEYENHIARTLDELSESGLIPEDTHLFRLFLLGGLNWTINWYRSDGELTIEQLADRFLALFPSEKAATGTSKAKVRR